MIKSYKYKLYNNKKYLKKYDKWISICRYLYNAAKETKEVAYSSGITYRNYDLHKQLTEAKKDVTFLKIVHSQVLKDVLDRLDLAYDNYFRNLKNGNIYHLKKLHKSRTSSIDVKNINEIGKPKWAKKGSYRSMTFPQNVVKTNSGFKLPMFGEVRVFNNKRIINGKIKQAKLSKDVSGLYLIVIVDENDRCRESQSKSVVALDMGVKHYCVTSDGDFIENPKFYKNQLKRLKAEQSKLTKKYRKSKSVQSKNYYKQAIVVARLHKDVYNARNDFLHKLSKKLSTKYSTIIIEDLNIQKMVSDKKISIDILDCGWGKFFDFLKYKTENLIRLNPSYSSQECSVCSFISKNNRKSQSRFKCINCGHEDNADLNAAKVLLKRYLEGASSNLEKI